MMLHLVFVYGTLRQGSWNHGLLSGQRLLGQGATKDEHALYVDHVPYVAKEPVSRIRGEAYAVDGTCLAALDQLEDHPREYRREQVSIGLDSGETITAWLYFHPNPKGKLIPSGDFLEEERD
jgi:gamma-glutamylcyclotransferase (GGCT)/AIG2-like uncharacterized protein YtfP